MSELKPCPFCGGKAEIFEISGYNKYEFWARCDDCNSKTAVLANKTEAIKAWNTRVEVEERARAIIEHFIGPDAPEDEVCDFLRDHIQSIYQECAEVAEKKFPCWCNKHAQHPYLHEEGCPAVYGAIIAGEIQREASKEK